MNDIAQGYPSSRDWSRYPANAADRAEKSHDSGRGVCVCDCGRVRLRTRM